MGLARRQPIATKRQLRRAKCKKAGQAERNRDWRCETGVDGRENRIKGPSQHHGYREKIATRRSPGHLAWVIR